MIQINNATKRFDQKTAISSLSLDIDSGVIGLVGQNGAGKSTLLRMIAGVYNADKGEILVDSFPSTSKESKELIFFLPDDPFAPINSNIAAVKEFYQLFYCVDEDIFENLIDKFNLPRNVRVTKFSKGMRRLLFIALSLSISCRYLLLDEAFDGLDPLVLETVKEQIVRICKDKEKTVVVSSHNVTALEKLVDKFVIIHDGRLSNDGDLYSLCETFIKYQAIFDKACDEETLLELGLNVLSYRKAGSIHNFVINNKENKDVEKILSTLKPSLLETVAIDANEIILLQMAMANKEDKHHEKA